MSEIFFYESYIYDIHGYHMGHVVNNFKEGGIHENLIIVGCLLSLVITLFCLNTTIHYYIVFGYFTHLFFVIPLNQAIYRFLGRSSMIGWRKNSWNPERVPREVTFMYDCLSVCSRATGHTFWPRNLIFGLSDPWDIFFEIFIFTLFIVIFQFLSLYNTTQFLVSSYQSQFFT